LSFIEIPTKEIDEKEIKEIKNSDAKLNEENRKIKDDEIDVNIEDPILAPNDYIASCFEYKCEGVDLYLRIKNQNHRCRSGDIIEIKGYQGYVFCPDNENLCSDKFKCKFGCVDHYSNSNQFFEFSN
jgi:hypothetical protein